MSLNIELARHNMVEQQVRPWEVLDSRVLEALTAIRREDFVPPGYRNLAFADLGLPLAHGEFMMKPVVEGRVLQAVVPTRAESVLEIGTGSGFLTACLARLAASVHSIEQHADLADAADANLRGARVGNAMIIPDPIGKCTLFMRDSVTRVNWRTGPAVPAHAPHRGPVARIPLGRRTGVAAHSVCSPFLVAFGCHASRCRCRLVNDLLVDSGGRAIECRDEQGDDFQLTARPLDRCSPVALR